MEIFEGDDEPAGWMMAGFVVAYPVVGLLSLFKLLAPLGGWIERQQHLLGMLGPVALLGLVLARFLRPKVRWLLALPCCWCVACWLALFFGRFLGIVDWQVIIGITAIFVMGMLLPVLLDWPGSKVADPVQAGDDGGAA